MFELIYIRKAVKYLRIKIKSEKIVEIVIPNSLSLHKVNEFLDSKKSWIESKTLLMQQRSQKLDLQKQELLEENGLNLDNLTQTELKNLSKSELTSRINSWAELLDLPFNRLTFRTQSTRWGSCSSRKSISLNCKLILTPEFVQDYVIVHELCHTKIMNHSKSFWDLVDKNYPNYKVAKKWLKQNGSAVMNLF